MAHAELFRVLSLGKEAKLKVVAGKPIDTINELVQRRQAVPRVSGRIFRSLCSSGGTLGPLGSRARVAIVTVKVRLATGRELAVVGGGSISGQYFSLCIMMVYADATHHSLAASRLDSLHDLQGGLPLSWTHFLLRRRQLYACRRRLANSLAKGAPVSAMGQARWTYARQAMAALRLMAGFAGAAGPAVDADGLPETWAAGDVDAIDEAAVEPKAELAYETLGFGSITASGSNAGLRFQRPPGPPVSL